MKFTKTLIAKELRKIGYRFSNLVLIPNCSVVYIERFFNHEVIVRDYFVYYEIPNVCDSLKVGLKHIDFKEYLRLVS